MSRITGALLGLVALGAWASTTIAGPGYNNTTNQVYCAADSRLMVWSGSVSVLSNGLTGDTSPQYAANLPGCHNQNPHWTDAQIVLTGVQFGQQGDVPFTTTVRSLGVSVNKVSMLSNTLVWTATTEWEGNDSQGTNVAVAIQFTIIALNAPAPAVLMTDSISCTGSAGCSASKTSSTTMPTGYQFAGASLSAFRIVGPSGFTTGDQLNELTVDATGTSAGPLPINWRPAISCLLSGTILGVTQQGTQCSANLVAVGAIPTEASSFHVTETGTSSVDYGNTVTTSESIVRGNHCGLEKFHLVFPGPISYSLWSIWAGASHTDCGLTGSSSFTVNYFGYFGSISRPSPPPPPPWNFGNNNWGTNTFTVDLGINGMQLH